MRSRGERFNLPTISPPLPDNVYLRPNPPPPNLGADQWSRANRLLVLELARRRETAREDFLFLDEEDGKERPAMREIRLWETKGTIVSVFPNIWSQGKKLSISINVDVLSCSLWASRSLRRVPLAPIRLRFPPPLPRRRTESQFCLTPLSPSGEWFAGRFFLSCLDRKTVTVRGACRSWKSGWR